MRKREREWQGERGGKGGKREREGAGEREGGRERETEREMVRKRERVGRRERQRESLSATVTSHSVVLKKMIISIRNIDVQFEKKVFTCS